MLAERGEQRATIEDFVQAAGVARSTFYNYYRTVGDLIDDLWLHIGRDPFLAIQSACASIESPAERFVAKARLVLRVAARNPTWGWVVYSLSQGEETVNADLLGYPRPDLADGLRQGAFRFDDLEAANDMAVSTLRGALHAVLREQRPDGYATAICRLLLRALGVAEGEAKIIVERPLPSLDDLPPGSSDRVRV